MTWRKEFDMRLGCAVHFKGDLRAIVTRDGDERFWHISVSCANRYPTWEEIKEARYALIPAEVLMAQMLPPKAEYVNLHPNTFHLHEVRQGAHVFQP